MQSKAAGKVPPFPSQELLCDPQLKEAYTHK